MTTPSSDPLADKLKRLRLYGCLASIADVRGEPWLERLLAIEREEHTRRSLAHRSHLAGVGAFKPLCDFDWAWPKNVDRAPIEDLFTLRFIAEGENVVLLGPNGVGKTMLLRNIAHRALHARPRGGACAPPVTCSPTSPSRSPPWRARGGSRHTCVRTCSASTRLDICPTRVRHADLLFEVVTRRHEKKRSIVLTTNKAFAEWPTTFPNAACVVALVDRLVNRADIVVIDAESYRLHEAEERQRARASSRKKTKENAPR